MKRPAAFTLLEMVVAIALTGAALGLAGVLFARLLSGDQAGARHATRTAGLERLAVQWRRDVHVATAVTLEPAEPQPATLARLTIAGRDMVYEALDNAVTRRESLSGSMIAEETYRLGDVRVEGFTLGGDANARTVRLALRHFGPLARRPADDSQGGRPLVLDAAYGLDRQLTEVAP